MRHHDRLSAAIGAVGEQFERAAALGAACAGLLSWHVGRPPTEAASMEARVNVPPQIIPDK